MYNNNKKLIYFYKMMKPWYILVDEEMDFSKVPKLDELIEKNIKKDKWKVTGSTNPIEDQLFDKLNIETLTSDELVQWIKSDIMLST